MTTAILIFLVFNTFCLFQIANTIGQTRKKLDGLCSKMDYLVEREQIRAGVPPENR